MSAAEADVLTVAIIAAAMPLRIAPFVRYVISVDGTPSLFERSPEAAMEQARIALRGSPGAKVVVWWREPESGEKRVLYSSEGGKR